MAEEIESRKGTFDITNVNGVNIVEKAGEDSFAEHIPTAIDYLRRCDNDEQAEATINYLEKERNHKRICRSTQENSEGAWCQKLRSKEGGRLLP